MAIRNETGERRFFLVYHDFYSKSITAKKVRDLPPKYFEDVIKSDYARYGKLTRDIGFKPHP
jgi:hypothetical protein